MHLQPYVIVIEINLSLFRFGRTLPLDPPLFEPWLPFWKVSDCLSLVFLPDVDECKNLKLCPGQNEHCKNMPGFYSCKCDSGFTRKEGKCVKGKKRKQKKSDTTKSDDEKLLEAIQKGNTIEDWHLKVGSLLYAIFFALLIWAFSKRSAVGVISLVVLYIGVLFGIRTRYNEAT